MPSASPLLLAAVPEWVAPLWIVLAGVAAAAVGLAGAYGLLLLAAPKVAAIARVGWKQALAQPAFYILALMGAVMFALLVVLPFNTFGDDLRMMKEASLTLVLALCAFFGVWLASESVAEELEGKTAITLLSKPISRLQFVVGKFCGVMASVLTLFVILGALFMTSVAYKVKFEARELVRPEPKAAEVQAEMLAAAPALVLQFFAVAVLAAISVALSTRLPMVPNLLTVAAIYVVGNVAPQLAQSSAGNLPVVAFVGQLVATLLPVMEHFDVRAAIASGRAVPLDYLLWAALYCVLYSTVALLLALVMFDDRDLA